MTASLRLEMEGAPPRLVLRVSGEVDLSNVDRFRRSLGAGEGDGSVLVVDLEGVDYLDSAGIAALFDRARRGRLEIVAGPGCVARPLIRITRLDEVAHLSTPGEEAQSPAGTESGKN